MHHARPQASALCVARPSVMHRTFVAVTLYNMGPWWSAYHLLVRTNHAQCHAQYL